MLRGKVNSMAINYAERESWLKYQYFIAGITQNIPTAANIRLFPPRECEEHPVSSGLGGEPPPGFTKPQAALTLLLPFNKKNDCAVGHAAPVLLQGKHGTHRRIYWACTGKGLTSHQVASV